MLVGLIGFFAALALMAALFVTGMSKLVIDVLVFGEDGVERTKRWAERLMSRWWLDRSHPTNFRCKVVGVIAGFATTNHYFDSLRAHCLQFLADSCGYTQAMISQVSEKATDIGKLSDFLASTISNSECGDADFVISIVSSATAGGWFVMSWIGYSFLCTIAALLIAGLFYGHILKDS